MVLKQVVLEPSTSAWKKPLSQDWYYNQGAFLPHPCQTTMICY